MDAIVLFFDKRNLFCHNEDVCEFSAYICALITFNFLCIISENHINLENHKKYNKLSIQYPSETSFQ